MGVTVTCTRSRWKVEKCFGIEKAFQISGCIRELPNQYLQSCGIPGFENQSILYVWLLIVDALNYDWSPPIQYQYPTVDTYFDHGRILKERVEKENPLSSYSGITWDRDDIFRKPTRNERTGSNRPITKTKLMNQAQTHLPTVTPDEFGSITMGSFQEKVGRQLITKLR